MPQEPVTRRELLATVLAAFAIVTFAVTAMSLLS
jgi:hypothetical protein